MIIDKTNGRLDEIKAFAKAHDLMESFNDTFARLETYSAKGYEVSLYSDFAPLSLEFSITDQGRFVLNGGFIFHGKHDGFGNGGKHLHFLFHSQQKRKPAGVFTHKIYNNGLFSLGF